MPQEFIHSASLPDFRSENTFSRGPELKNSLLIMSSLSFTKPCGKALLVFVTPNPLHHAWHIEAAQSVSIIFINDSLTINMKKLT